MYSEIIVSNIENVSGTPIITVNKIENCYFDSTTVRDVTFKSI